MPQCRDPQRGGSESGGLPAAVMSALRDGWLLEESEEDWQETSCFRLTVDQTGEQNGKILSTSGCGRRTVRPSEGRSPWMGKSFDGRLYELFLYDTIENQE